MFEDLIVPENEHVIRPDHYSASTINNFITNRPQWFMDKVLARRQAITNPSFARGIAVEHGLNLWFSGKPVNECIEAAEEVYNQKTKNDCYMHHIRKMVDELTGYFFKRNWYPDTAQESFEVFIEGARVEGYLDYKKVNPNDRSRHIIDLKTSSKTPSKLSQSYAIQGTIYSLAYSNANVEFVFCIPLKDKVKVKGIPLTPKEVDESIPLIKGAIRGIDEFYDLFSMERTNRLKKIFMPDPSSFWNQSDIDHAKEVFGMNGRTSRHIMVQTSIFQPHPEETIIYENEPIPKNPETQRTNQFLKALRGG